MAYHPIPLVKIEIESQAGPDMFRAFAFNLLAELSSETNGMRANNIQFMKTLRNASPDFLWFFRFGSRIAQAVQT